MHSFGIAVVCRHGGAIRLEDGCFFLIDDLAFGDLDVRALLDQLGVGSIETDAPFTLILHGSGGLEEALIPGEIGVAKAGFHILHILPTKATNS